MIQREMTRTERWGRGSSRCGVWALVALVCGLCWTATAAGAVDDDELSAEARASLRERTGLNEAQLDTLLKIIDEGKNRNQTLQHLTHLCNEIGPRLTGSSRAEQANRWVAEQFRAFGLQNVSLHEWGQLPVRFDRGPCTGKMVEPSEREFQFTARAWSAGTDGPKRGPVLPEPATQEEFDAVAGQMAGAWMLRKAGAEPSAFLDRMLSAGIHGVIMSSNDELVRTGGVSGLTQLDFAQLPPGVTVIVRRSDYDAIRSRLADGDSVVVEFDLQHQFTKGPIACYNTIGEIPGSEHPEEIVIVSAHLDSWDGPGSQGTVDNGTGASVTIEAGRILATAGVKPKRTIRIILWTGEEQGLLGSRAYVESLSDEERARISAVFVDDSGTNQESSLNCHTVQQPILQHAVEAMNHAFPDAPIELIVSERAGRGRRGGGASDHASFNAVGIPGFFWGKTGLANYRHAWHTQNDRLDQAIPEYLVKNSTVSAITAYVLAEADTLLPRLPEEEEETDASAPSPNRSGAKTAAAAAQPPRMPSP